MADATGPPAGLVVLVGGGPGADDLITVRGLDRLLAADVVIYDRLGPTGLLDRLGPSVEIIDAGRAAGRRTLTYDEIVALMIDRARAGKTVVRLKGGDPFAFAHGAQEVRACTDAGLRVEVVPGVTSATAAPVLAGVAVTNADGAAGFSVVSGHLDPEDPSAARSPGRRVLVLGGSRSGKSRHAEQLLTDQEPVTYVATGHGDPADAEWTARIERHRRRRSTAWATAETTDPAMLIHQTDAGALLIDSVTTWVAQVMDDCGCWSPTPTQDADQRLADALDTLVDAWAATSVTVVAVSDEVGSGVVPATASGRRFRDTLGELNQRLAATADEVWLVTAGIPSRLR
jgi:adenosylcobinamide kinase/adenosylcobinamide-phosphate guanylyltransferase